MTTDTVGSAYPNNNSDGMSWLDAYAMKAMQGLIAQRFGDDRPSEEVQQVTARTAYGFAVAMLAEKRRREGGQA